MQKSRLKIYIIQSSGPSDNTLTVKIFSIDNLGEF